jgi:hypothetical protein
MLPDGGLAVPTRSGSRDGYVSLALSFLSEVSTPNFNSCTAADDVLMPLASDGVESFVVEPIQNRVFTLHTKGEIRYSEASTNGWIERGVCSQGSINTAFKNAGLTPTRVISISAIGANESRRYCLLAVTENGMSNPWARS